MLLCLFVHDCGNRGSGAEGFYRAVPVKVSPLETHNKYAVLVAEETKDNGSPTLDPMLVTYYAINFLSKLRTRVRQSPKSKNSIPQKTRKSFICSAHIDHEIVLQVGLKTVDTHAL
jgi:hypothetical protein